LEKLPREVITRIVKSVEELSLNPYPQGIRKLVGAENTYRLREGSYRVIYTVAGKALTVEILRIRHRKDIYSR
jgi:mRNA interferase RelE/StbE